MPLPTTQRVIKMEMQQDDGYPPVFFHILIENDDEHGHA